MTPSEYYTYLFYLWEYRGRGYIVSDTPIYLEPPFIPFFRHGYKQTTQDDGRRPTIASRFLERFKPKKKTVITEEIQLLDYETIEPFIYTDTPTLQALQIKIPKERKLSVEQLRSCLTMLMYTESTVAFEILGTYDSIIIQFVASEIDIPLLLTQLQAYFSDYTILQNNTYIEHILKANTQTASIDFGLAEEFVRPLSLPKNFTIDPYTGLYGILDTLKEGEQAGIQILFQGAVNSWSRSIMASVSDGTGKSFFSDTPEAPKIALEKIQSPLFGVTIRAFAQAKTQNQAHSLLGQLAMAIVQTGKGMYNQLIPLPSQNYEFEDRVSDIYLRESHRLGMLLNADELLNFIHFPGENIKSKKLFSGNRKTVATPNIAKNKTTELGYNIHNNLEEKVSVSMDDRVKHTHIIGATGTGKSTLLATLIIEDAKKGLGLCVFDPHGDLIDDVIARVPSERLREVVLIDPSDTNYPIGLNILQAHNDIEREIVSSDLVASFRKLSTSWGDQMNAVFGNAILAMLESNVGGTLHDIRRFLIEPSFREQFLQTVQDPSVIYYWQREYPHLKTNSIGPILTRLDTFLRPKSIRNMIVQKQGLDFDTLLSTNKLILVKLSQGLIGTENSYLLGSLILSKIHQAILARQRTQSRSPFFLYLDEFQNFITPSIKDMLSGVRKYNAGLLLSHQDMTQLQREDGELLNAVLNNVYTRIAFRVGEQDAKRLQDSFTHFDATDLQSLGRAEAILRIEQPHYDCSLNTYPLISITQEEKEQRIQKVLSNTRRLYATEKEEVEKQLFESLQIQKTKEPSVKFQEEKPPTKETYQQEETLSIKKGINEIEIQPTQKDNTKPVQEKPSKAIDELKAQQKQILKTRDNSTHRYLQNLVKKMAESKGYVATIEKTIANGSIDVELQKDNKKIAIEICVTTDADWEVHNIQKCIDLKYDVVISVSGDKKQLDKIQKKYNSQTQVQNEVSKILFYTPDELFTYFDAILLRIEELEQPTEQIIKGYRVNVQYEQITTDDMQRKRKSIAEVVMNSLRKKK